MRGGGGGGGGRSLSTSHFLFTLIPFVISFSLLALIIIYLLSTPKFYYICNPNFSTKFLGYNSLSLFRCIIGLSKLTFPKLIPFSQNLLLPQSCLSQSTTPFSQVRLKSLRSSLTFLFHIPHPICQQNPISSTFTIDTECTYFFQCPLLLQCKSQLSLAQIITRAFCLHVLPMTPLISLQCSSQSDPVKYNSELHPS